MGADKLALWAKLLAAKTYSMSSVPGTLMAEGENGLQLFLDLHKPSVTQAQNKQNVH